MRQFWLFFFMNSQRACMANFCEPSLSTGERFLIPLMSPHPFLSVIFSISKETVLWSQSFDP